MPIEWSAEDQITPGFKELILIYDSESCMFLS